MLLSYGDERSYQGNAGYPDESGVIYRYDSNVQNHKRVAIGDVVIIVNHGSGPGELTPEGVGRISRIVAETGTKVLERCPACGITRFKPRKTLQPRYRCEDSHTFDIPVAEDQPVMLFAAYYGDKYVAADGTLSSAELRGLMLNGARQLAIRPIDGRKLAGYGSRIAGLSDVLSGIAFASSENQS